MATNKATKPQATVTPSINAGKLTFVPGKARADHNATRAKAVNGMSMAQAITHYATLGYKKVDLNYDLNKIKSLKLS
jgi:hypothetical protein|tara:strand:+ start:229 stop:459 length:231 start_codon:yes stop_codon:yes gene_type:complete